MKQAKQAKKSFMVAVKRRFIFDAVIYVEQIAATACDAVELVKRDSRLRENEMYFDEIKECLDSNDFTAKQPRFISCGRANQYHRENDCAICSTLLKAKQHREGAK